MSPLKPKRGVAFKSRINTLSTTQNLQIPLCTTEANC